MSDDRGLPRVTTGVRNLDGLLQGGLPSGSVTVVAGPPGSGKTILAQQLAFHAATPEQRVLYFGTLSEPTAKTLRHLGQFSFFDAARLERDVHFVDLGVIVRAEGLDRIAPMVMEQIKTVKPAVVIIDSFKSFDDLASSPAELRKFGYELAVSLMAWETTALLLGEYGEDDYVRNPVFSVVDGLVTMSQRVDSGECQRFLQIVKMRGTAHDRESHPFAITRDGIELFAPRPTFRSVARREPPEPRCHTGIGRLDELLGEGIPRGSSLLVAGVAGTGKTALLLELVLRGALAGERGIVFSFEETAERLLATAAGLGFALEPELARGMIELVVVPQPEIAVEADLAMIRARVERLGARRVAIDSVSVFLHRIADAHASREKVFELASIVQNAGAVGFFATDIAYGSQRISRFGVEETVVDGVLLLSATEEGFERRRYLEVYKLRNTAHLSGRHSMTIGRGGIQVFPRYDDHIDDTTPPPPLAVAERLPSGVEGLDGLLGGGLLGRSATLLAGSPGIGKTTLGLQFVLGGVARGEHGIVFALEENPQQLLATADQLGLPLRAAVEAGSIDVIFPSPERIRAAQFLTVLGDEIRRTGARRVLLDGVGRGVRGDAEGNELRRMLAKLVARFKSLDATTMVTSEANSLYFGDDVTESAFSQLADNVVLLRYVERDGQLSPALRVVKCRGSAHDRGTHAFELGAGGIRMGERLTDRPWTRGRGLIAR